MDAFGGATSIYVWLVRLLARIADVEGGGVLLDPVAHRADFVEERIIVLLE